MLNQYWLRRFRTRYDLLWLFLFQLHASEQLNSSHLYVVSWLPFRTTFIFAICTQSSFFVGRSFLYSKSQRIRVGLLELVKFSLLVFGGSPVDGQIFRRMCPGTSAACPHLFTEAASDIVAVQLHRYMLILSSVPFSLLAHLFPPSVFLWPQWM